MFNFIYGQKKTRYYTSSNNNVPIIYGQVRSAGQLVSGYIKTTNHGKGDLIQVSEQFAA